MRSLPVVIGGMSAADTYLSSSLQTWLDHELEVRGIDAVIYTRYILGILLQDDHCVQRENGDETQFFPPSKKTLSSWSTNSDSSVRDSKRKSNELTAEEFKKLEATNYLLSIADESAGIERLVDELYSKIKEREDRSVKNNGLSKVAHSCSAQYTPDDPAERYYAAFPALSIVHCATSKDFLQPPSTDWSKLAEQWSKTPTEQLDSIGFMKATDVSKTVEVKKLPGNETEKEVWDMPGLAAIAVLLASPDMNGLQDIVNTAETLTRASSQRLFQRRSLARDLDKLAGKGSSEVTVADDLNNSMADGSHDQNFMKCYSNVNQEVNQMEGLYFNSKVDDSKDDPSCDYFNQFLFYESPAELDQVIDNTNNNKLVNGHTSDEIQISVGIGSEHLNSISLKSLTESNLSTIKKDENLVNSAFINNNSIMSRRNSGAINPGHLAMTDFTEENYESSEQIAMIEQNIIPSKRLFERKVITEEQVESDIISNDDLLWIKNLSAESPEVETHKEDLFNVQQNMVQESYVQNVDINKISSNDLCNLESSIALDDQNSVNTIVNCFNNCPKISNNWQDDNQLLNYSHVPMCLWDINQNKNSSACDFECCYDIKLYNSDVAKNIALRAAFQEKTCKSLISHSINSAFTTDVPPKVDHYQLLNDSNFSAKDQCSKLVRVKQVLGTELLHSDETIHCCYQSVKDTGFGDHNDEATVCPDHYFAPIQSPVCCEVTSAVTTSTECVTDDESPLVHDMTDLVLSHMLSSYNNSTHGCSVASGYQVYLPEDDLLWFTTSTFLPRFKLQKFCEKSSQTGDSLASSVDESHQRSLTERLLRDMKQVLTIGEEEEGVLHNVNEALLAGLKSREELANDTLAYDPTSLWTESLANDLSLFNHQDRWQGSLWGQQGHSPVHANVTGTSPQVLWNLDTGPLTPVWSQNVSNCEPLHSNWPLKNETEKCEEVVPNDVMPDSRLAPAELIVSVSSQSSWTPLQYDPDASLWMQYTCSNNPEDMNENINKLKDENNCQDSPLWLKISSVASEENMFVKNHWISSDADYLGTQHTANANYTNNNTDVWSVVSNGQHVWQSDWNQCAVEGTLDQICSDSATVKEDKSAEKEWPNEIDNINNVIIDLWPVNHLWCNDHVNHDTTQEPAVSFPAQLCETVPIVDSETQVVLGNANDGLELLQWEMEGLSDDKCVKQEPSFQSNTSAMYDQQEDSKHIDWYEKRIHAFYSHDLEKQWLHDVPSQPTLSPKKRTQPNGGGHAKPCSYYLEGSCFRSDCKFSHDLASITCKFWKLGECFKGSSCPFLHGIPSENTVSLPKQLKKADFRYDKENFPELMPGKKKNSSGTQELLNNKNMTTTNGGKDKYKRKVSSQPIDIKRKT